MKTIQGNLIHLTQNGEFDFIVHGCHCFWTMGAGWRVNIEHRTPNIEHRMEENLELPKIGAGNAEGIKAVFCGLCRPFRAWNPVGDGTHGAALGYRMMPRWGGGGRTV